MLLFRSEEHLERWCAFRELPRGGTMSPAQCWHLAQAWYGDKLSPDWRRTTLEETEAVLTAVGLTEPFWSLRAGTGA
jgi:hypothetical protein